MVTKLGYPLGAKGYVCVKILKNWALHKNEYTLTRYWIDMIEICDYFVRNQRMLFNFSNIFQNSTLGVICTLINSAKIGKK